MSNDKLVNALHELKSIANALPALATKTDVIIRLERAERMAATINKIIQAHDAEAAQAQPQSGEWVMVPREPTEAMVEAAHNSDECPDGPSSTPDFKAAYVAMLAAAPQQAAEPVAVIESAEDRHGPYLTHANVVLRVWNGYVPKAGDEIYTHPQPAQDASKYQELLMAVSKKFPNESRHETALRYIKQTELQSCEPKCDAAMAKESGNG